MGNFIASDIKETELTRQKLEPRDNLSTKKRKHPNKRQVRRLNGTKTQI
jgi:hypothetical protein